MSAQRPLELILARNLLASISTPAFLVGEEGRLFRIATPGRNSDVAASAIPIVGPTGATGAIVIFWPTAQGSGPLDAIATPSQAPERT